MFKNEVIK